MEKITSKSREIKIAFTGPESSGKTSLSRAIAQEFKAQWYPEFAREYLTRTNGVYDFEDIEKIAVGQELQRNELNTDKQIKIYDTEGIVLYVWSEFKYNKVSEKVTELLNNQQFDHYFLCSPNDIPWEEDPLREHPHHREELFQIYWKHLAEKVYSFTILEGNMEERKEKVREVLSSLDLRA